MIPCGRGDSVEQEERASRDWMNVRMDGSVEVSCTASSMDAISGGGRGGLFMSLKIRKEPYICR